MLMRKEMLLGGLVGVEGGNLRVRKFAKRKELAMATVLVMAEFSRYLIVVCSGSKSSEKVCIFGRGQGVAAEGGACAQAAHGGIRAKWGQGFRMRSFALIIPMRTLAAMRGASMGVGLKYRVRRPQSHR